MSYEVEQKFPVVDTAALEEKLSDLGATLAAPISEIDHYYAHPVRDFAKTDEALRTRRSDRGNSTTYKGPKVDKTTKTRREIEVPLSADERQVAAWESMLESLGFTPVGEVCKYRRKVQLVWQGRKVEVSLDEVMGLGTFVELELLADEKSLDAARDCIAALASELGLKKSQRRSYLELLMCK